jgi:hypothetical protein
VLGLSEIGLAINIVVFAVTTAIVAVLVGAAMQRRGWSADFMIKLRLVFSVLLVQTRLTALAPGISGEPLLLAWIVASALAMGIGTPATFGLTVDLVPVRARGFGGSAHHCRRVYASCHLVFRLADRDVRQSTGAVDAAGCSDARTTAWGRFQLVERLGLPAGTGKAVLSPEQ